MILSIVSIILVLVILLVLALASWHDLKYRTIEKKSVIYLYILIPIYLFVSGKDMTVASFCFLFTLIVFTCLWAISMKQFGGGDVLVISSLGWMIADFNILRAFLLTMGVMSIPWGIFWWLYYNHKEGYTGLMYSLKKTLPISNIKPGMVLARDGFMHGLNEEDIARLKKEGYEMVDVKQPFPFIPVVFTSLLTYILFPTLHIF